MEKLTRNILVDDREKSPNVGRLGTRMMELTESEEGKGDGSKIVVERLKSGDFQLQAYDKQGVFSASLTVVEAKWLSGKGDPTDLFRSMSEGCVRLKDELKRMAECFHSQLFLIEGKASNLLGYESQGGVRFDRNILPFILKNNTRHRIPFLIAPNAVEYLAQWLRLHLFVDSEDLTIGTENIERLPEDQPRPVYRKKLKKKGDRVVLNAKALEDALAHANDIGLQFFCNFPAPSSRDEIRRLVAYMIKWGWGFWFLDGYSDQRILEIAEQFEQLECSAALLRKSGGFPKAPDGYDHSLRTYGSYRGIKTPRRRESLAIAFDDAGENPVVVRFVKPKHREFSRILLQPLGSIAYQKIKKPRDLEEWSVVAGEVTMPQPILVRSNSKSEVELVAEVCQALRKYWSPKTEVAPVKSEVKSEAETETRKTTEAKVAQILKDFNSPTKTGSGPCKTQTASASTSKKKLTSSSTEPSDTDSKPSRSSNSQPALSQPEPAETTKPGSSESAASCSWEPVKIDLSPSLEKTSPGNLQASPSTALSSETAITLLTQMSKELAAISKRQERLLQAKMARHKPTEKEEIKVNWNKYRDMSISDQGRRAFGILIMGAAKMGKTSTAAEIYKHWDPSRIYYVEGDEGDGFVVAQKQAGNVRLPSINFRHFERMKAPLKEFLAFLKAFNPADYDFLIFDSYDGIGRCADRIILQSEAAQVEESIGIPALDRRCHGFRLAFFKLLSPELERIVAGGCTVIATCGIREEGKVKTRVVADIQGQYAMILARAFSTVALIDFDADGDRLFITDPTGRKSVIGTRDPEYFETMFAEDFGGILAGAVRAIRGEEIQEKAVDDEPEPDAQDTDFEDDEISQASDESAHESESEPEEELLPDPEQARESDEQDAELLTPVEQDRGAVSKNRLAELIRANNLEISLLDWLASCYESDSNFDNWNPPHLDLACAINFIELYAHFAGFAGEEVAEQFLDLMPLYMVERPVQLMDKVIDEKHAEMGKAEAFSVEEVCEMMRETLQETGNPFELETAAISVGEDDDVPF